MTHKKTQTTKIHAQTRPPTQHGTNHQRSALTTLTGNHTTNTPTRKNSHQSIHREPNTQFSIFILDTLLDTQPPHPHPNNQPQTLSIIRRSGNQLYTRKPPTTNPNHQACDQKPTRKNQPPNATTTTQTQQTRPKTLPARPEPRPGDKRKQYPPPPPNTNHNPMTPITHPQNPPTTPKTPTTNTTTKPLRTYKNTRQNNSDRPSFPLFAPICDQAPTRQGRPNAVALAGPAMKEAGSPSGLPASSPT